MASDLTITTYDDKGKVVTHHVITWEERKRAHDEGRCDAMCSICYQEACDHLDNNILGNILGDIQGEYA